MRSRLDAHIRKVMAEPIVIGPPDRFHRGPGAIVNDCYVVTNSGHVTVEGGALVGQQVALLAGTHDARATGAERKAFPPDGCDILIREGAWIGSRAIILGPATIGRDAVVGAGAIVTKDVPDRAIVYGPAAEIRDHVPQ